MAISGELSPEQYEILFGESPPTITIDSHASTLAQPLVLVDPVHPRRWNRRNVSRVLQFGVLFVALAAAVLLLGIAADSVFNTAASGR